MRSAAQAHRWCLPDLKDNPISRIDVPRHARTPRIACTGGTPRPLIGHSSASHSRLVQPISTSDSFALPSPVLLLLREKMGAATTAFPPAHTFGCPLSPPHDILVARRGGARGDVGPKKMASGPLRHIAPECVGLLICKAPTRHAGTCISMGAHAQRPFPLHRIYRGRHPLHFPPLYSQRPGFSTPFCSSSGCLSIVHVH